MEYVVKNEQGQLVRLTVVSGLPIIPEGFELIGLESEFNPNNIDLSLAELSEIEIEPAQQILIRPAQEAQAEVLAQDAVLDEQGNEIAPAIQYQPAVAASEAIYETIPAVKKTIATIKVSALREKKLSAIREKRKALLSEADILVNIAYDNGTGIAAAKAYRQALRDCTETFIADMSLLDSVDVDTYVFPSKP